MSGQRGVTLANVEARRSCSAMICLTASWQRPALLRLSQGRSHRRQQCYYRCTKPGQVGIVSLAFQHYTHDQPVRGHRGVIHARGQHEALASRPSASSILSAVAGAPSPTCRAAYSSARGNSAADSSEDLDQPAAQAGPIAVCGSGSRHARSCADLQDCGCTLVAATYVAWLQPGQL